MGRYDVVSVWGSQGDGTGELQSPLGVAVDTQGFVYIADTSNHRIMKFTAAGESLDSWGHFSPSDHDEWDAGFDTPIGIAVDHLDNVYIADCRNARIQHWSSDGVFVRSWRRVGKHRGPLSPPAGVAVDPSGNVYVSDGGNGLIQVFDGDTLRCQAIWGGWSDSPADGRFRRRVGFRGIAVDADGTVYATDPGNHRVQKFTRTGRFVGAWGALGDQPGQFRTPLGVAVDSDGHVYVVDSLNNRVQKFSSDGGFLTEWGRLGTAPGEFHDPVGIAVAENGRVYVTDASNHRVQAFASAPAPS
ncbi:MAG: hypothetical protein WBB78_07125 [Propionicimonas sp.]